LRVNKLRFITQQRLTRWVQQEGFQRVREESNWGVQWVVKGEKLDLVDGSAPSETAEEPIHVFSIRGAGDVRALTTLDSFAPAVGEK
jgi:hypothetical protein